MMKALLLSALTVGISLAQVSKYYIGNYTASGIVASVPYPLDICLSTGFGAANAIFSCKNSSYVSRESFTSTDSSCTGTPTTSVFQSSAVRGKAGYVNCEGETSYMLIDQYIGSCSNWQNGKVGTTTTTVAVDACVLYNVTSQATLYSKSHCNGTGQLTTIYAGDNTCTTSGAIVKRVYTPLGCNFFGTQSGLNIYSAMRQCIVAGTAQRCTTSLVTYSAFVTFHNLTGSYDFAAIYNSIFSYATVAVEVVMEVHDYTMILLNLTFCTQWEDNYYKAKVKSLGATTASAATFDATEICWTCDSYTCSNSPLCGTDDYCNTDEQCYDLTSGTTTSTSSAGSTTTTETPKSAVGIYVSVFTLISLLLFVGVF